MVIQLKLERIKVLKKILYTCPNPNCQKKFETLIIVHDHSKKRTEKYYACPQCLTELDPTTTQGLEKEEILIEEKTETERTHPEREIPPGCSNYLGYLRNHLNDALPEECLICTKMLECTRLQKELASSFQPKP
jgi:hypothetical protein